MSSRKQKIGATQQSEHGSVNSSAKGFHRKAKLLDFTTLAGEAEVLVAQAQFVDQPPPRLTEGSSVSEPAGSILYIEVPSQSEATKQGEGPLISHGQESGIWAFSMADIDTSLLGFLGVVATGVLSYRETNKGNGSATSLKNPSQASGALGILDESVQFDVQTSAALSREVLQSEVLKFRIDLSQSSAEVGDTVELLSGERSFGKTVLTQADVDGKFVDLKLSSPLNDQHHAKVVLTKAGGATDADTVVIDVNLTAGMQDTQTGNASEHLAAAWNDTSVAAQTATAAKGLHTDVIL